MRNKFDNDELEIAIVTRGRGEIVKKLLAETIDDIVSANVVLSVHDSSADDITENVVKEYSEKGYCIVYHKYDYDMSIAEKYINTIIYSNAKYVWPIGDSNYIDFVEVFRKIYSYIKSEYDLLVVWGKDVLELEKVDYQNPNQLFADCLWHMTWLGGEIYNKELYKDIVSEQTKKNILYKTEHEAGSWYPQLGILFDALSDKKDMSARVISTQIRALTSKEKGQAWVKDSYRTWCRDLCLWEDNCKSVDREVIDPAVKYTFEHLKIDGHYWCIRSRIENGLTQELFCEYDDKGYIDRVSNHKARIKFWTYMPLEGVKIIYFIYGMLLQVKHSISSLLKR